MNIFLISNNLGKGGKERQISELLNYFKFVPEHMFYLVLREDKIEYEISNDVNLKIIKPEKRLSFFSFLKFLNVKIKAYNPRVIHTWEGGVALCASLIKIIGRNDLKIIDGTLRYSRRFPLFSKDFLVMKFNHMIADVIVSNSFAGLRSMEYTQRDRKILIIMNGLNLSRFNKETATPNNTLEETFRIGMIANFTKPKDYLNLIFSVIELKKRGRKVICYCIGEGDEKDFLLKQIPVEFMGAFEFTGSVGCPEDYLTKLDVGILLNKTGHSEGMSNSIMEYMAAGLPVICTNTGGNPELITEDFNGFLVQPGDRETVIKRIEQLMDDKQLGQKMGKRSREFAFRNFDISKCGNDYLRLYT